MLCTMTLKIMLRILVAVFWSNLNSYTTAKLVCNTNACKSVAKEILDFMDLSADPCQDFNKYACGGFEKKNSNKVSHTLQKPVNDLQDRIEKLLNGIKPTQNGFQTDEKVVRFYKACKFFRGQLDKHQLEHNWTDYMTRILRPYIKENLNKTGLHNWPYTSNDQLGPNFQWFDVVPKMVKEGMVYSDGLLELPIINVEVGPDDFDRSKYVLKIDSPKFEVIREQYNTYYLVTAGRSSTFQDGMPISLNEVMDILNPEVAHQRMLKRSLEIENGLEPLESWTKERIQGSIGHRNTRDYGNIFQVDPRTYNKTKISSLKPLTCGTVVVDHMCSAPTWEKYLTKLFKASGNSNIKIHSNDTIIIKDTSYFKTLNNRLKQLKIQPYEMANYLGWKIVIDTINLARNLEDDFNGNCVNYLLKGPENTIRRTRDGLLNAAVGSMYIRAYFDQNLNEKVEEIVMYVKKAAYSLLEHNTWMDKDTKEKAIRKLNNMKEFVGYPSELRNKTILDTYYKDLRITKNHAENIKAIAKFLVKLSFGNMRKKWDPDSWTLETHQIVNVVNAFYNPFLNEFTIPAGYLQDFNFNYENPMYLNFATTATTIGHEIIHGFDNNGKQFDENGKKQKEPGWWSHDTNAKYNSRAKCVVDQYSQFQVKQLPTKIHIDGKRTLGENIADIGGNRIAYYAYLLWTNKTQDKGILSNLPEEIQSSRKLFWIRSAHRFCATYDDPTLLALLQEDVHTVSGFRTNGSAMFSAEFAQDFKCSKGSPMNPLLNCSVDPFWVLSSTQKILQPNQLISNIQEISANGEKRNFNNLRSVLQFIAVCYLII